MNLHKSRSNGIARLLKSRSLATLVASLWLLYGFASDNHRIKCFVSAMIDSVDVRSS